MRRAALTMTATVLVEVPVEITFDVDADNAPYGTIDQAAVVLDGVRHELLTRQEIDEATNQIDLDEVMRTLDPEGQRRNAEALAAEEREASI